jgi:hypothetical protein
MIDDRTEEDAAVTARSAKGRARNILRTYTGWMIAINASLWVLWQVTEAMFPGSFLLLAMSRVPAATALALCSAVWYVSMEREIALAVSRNAKAIYFIAVVFISKFAMFLVAVHASTEMVSACYLAAASTALHLGMVFADAVPPQCGRWFWRIGATVVALNSAFFIYKTKSDPATYIEHYRMSGRLHFPGVRAMHVTTCRHVALLRRAAQPYHSASMAQVRVHPEGQVGQIAHRVFYVGPVVWLRVRSDGSRRYANGHGVHCIGACHIALHHA